MKKIVFLILLSLCSILLFAASGNSTQIIKSGHWIYDDLETLCMESKSEYFFETQPMTIGEMKFYFQRLPYENLSQSGKILYEKVKSFLNKNDDFFPNLELRFFTNLQVNPEFYYKSNPDVDWSFNYFIREFPITLPIIIGFSDYVTIEPDFMLGKNQFAANEPYNFTNIPYAGYQFEFSFPRFAYGAVGHAFDKWGVNFIAAREGMQIYNTQLGSIIYNRTFETDFYCSLNLYTEYLKYSLHIAEVDNTKFLYLHQLNMIPFRWLKINVLEGSLLNAPFELRYLNPFMIMHQFGSWTQYGAALSENENKYYEEGRFCAYLAFMFEVTPFKNFKIYGLYSQNEILDFAGARDDHALSYPDSLGGQLGFQYNINLKDKGMIKTYLEGVYTSPYLYVKQSPEWSLYRSRINMLNGEETVTWIGSPFGPDSFAVILKTEYDSQEKWKAGIGYTFSIHGENSASSLFSQYDDQTNNIYTYYPTVQYNLANENNDENGMQSAKDKGRYMWMTGINTYKHQVKIYGSYSFLENLNIYGQGVYTIQIYNNEIFHCIELGCGVEYKLFK